jgi:hypothetical protein
MANRTNTATGMFVLFSSNVLTANIIHIANGRASSPGTDQAGTAEVADAPIKGGVSSITGTVIFFRLQKVA